MPDNAINSYLRAVNIQQQIVNKIWEEGGLRSFNKQSILCNISDNQLIESALATLDIEDIKPLFNMFPLKKIKKVWLHTMVTQDDYYHSLNRFYAWYYFDIRHPDRYLKAMKTRHLTKIPT